MSCKTDFGGNKTSIELIRECAFGGTYFRDIFLVLLESCTKYHGKNLIS